MTSGKYLIAKFIRPSVQFPDIYNNDDGALVLEWRSAWDIITASFYDDHILFTEVAKESGGDATTRSILLAVSADDEADVDYLVYTIKNRFSFKVLEKLKARQR